MASLDEDYESSDDEDYVPETTGDDDVEVSSGDECDEVACAGEEEMNKGRGKRRKKSSKTSKAVDYSPSDDKEINGIEMALLYRNMGPSISAEDSAEVDEIFAALMAEQEALFGKAVKKEDTKSQKKDNGDDGRLWRSGSPGASSSALASEGRDECTPSSSTTTTTKITQVFDFAGEEIKVEKEVSVDEAREIKEKEEKREQLAAKKPTTKRVGGLGGALNLLAKKPKISVLDKSNLDWQSFKEQERIGEDLASFNRGKDGYLDKQQFLLKVDHDTFHIDKSKRMKRT